MSQTQVTEVNMPYVRLGKSGLKVSKIILYGIKHIKLAYDLGINAFDTSDVYSNGLSEVILGKAIKQHNLPRDEIVIMTKTYSPYNRDPNGPPVFGQSPDKLNALRYTNQYGLSPIKHSLERLQLDYVDLYQCHRFDADTPIEETMQALHDVVKAGYARYIGMSSCYAWQFHKMQAYAKAHHLTEFITMQDYHCATYREEEREMIPLCQDLGVGIIPWSPLARGFLTRPVSAQTTRGNTDFGKYAVGDHEKYPFMKTVNERVETIAKTRNVSMAQVALAWSCSKPFVSAPIIGTTSVEKLRDLVAGVHLKLTDEEIKSIDEPYEPRPIVGHK
ncbi:hypothetical protein FRB96_006355 [Tulasnella sp. 330]|nr:hypothetical protein FRB96_006355 [Tulasnella sp. 330]